MTDIQAINAGLEKATPQEVLAWAVDRYGDRVALSSSFGAEDVVLIHMLYKLGKRAKVFTLDTLRLPTETYQVIDEIRDRYDIDLEICYPDLTAVDRMVKDRGYNLFYNSIEERERCCGLRKVEPLNRALKDLDAWVTGLRRDQAATRSSVAKVEIDAVHGGIVKVNPLADWTSDQIWAYIREWSVPYNKLHDQGYPSIGCAPCTRAVAPGEDPRAGRWWWELDPEHKECGIHIGVSGSAAAGARDPVG